MKTHQYIGDMVIQAKKNSIEAYKASDEYSHAKKNRRVYWTTSLVVVVLILSLFAQKYVLEVWAAMLVLCFLLLGFMRYTSRNRSMVKKVGQKNKGYELWTEKSEDNHGELKVFIRITGADDAMNEERKVVRVAVVVICSSIALSILFSQISLGLLTLISSVYAAPALVSAIYGAIAIYKLNKTCIEQP